MHALSIRGCAFRVPNCPSTLLSCNINLLSSGVGSLSVPGKKKKVKVSVAQLCPTLCDPMDCSLPGSSVHGILQTRILEWVAIPFSRGSSWPRDWTCVSWIGGGFFTFLATQEASTLITRFKSYFSGLIISPRNSIVTSLCKRVITFNVYSVEEEAKLHHYLLKFLLGLRINRHQMD